MEVSQNTLQAFVDAYIDNVSDRSTLTSGNVTPVAIDIIDATGKLYYANQKYLDLYGCKKENILSASLKDFAVNEKHVKELADHLAWLVKDRPYPTPYIGLNKTATGDVLHVRVEWDYIIHNSEVLGFISVISNLSERIPNLERYRANEAIVNAMIQTMLCGVIILGASGAILEVNGLSTQILHQSREDLLGRELKELLIPVQSPKNLMKSEVIYSPGALVNEYRLKRKIEHQRRYVLIESASALIYKSTSSLIVFVKDITDEREEAHALAIKQRELEQRYRQSLLTEMISGIAHEMNQPLSAIANYTKGCINRLTESEQTDPAILQTLEMVVRQATRASNIINHMRQWNSGQRQKLRKVNIKKLIADSINLIEFDLMEAKIELDQLISLDCVDVYGCQIELEQVFINLLRNAIDAIMQKAKKDKKAQKKMIIEAQKGIEDMINIIVRDSGIGVRAEVVEHLFEPFFTTKHNGMGIGLALCEKIIEDHEGRLSYQKGEGDYATSFIISLPVYNEQKIKNKRSHIHAQMI